MKNKRVQRHNLPLIVSVVTLISILLFFIVFAGIKFSLLFSGVDASLIDTIFDRALVVLLALGLLDIIFISRISDEMYNRDPLTQIANSDKAAIFAIKKQFLKELPNYTGIFINLKDYKYINNKIGKELGDVVLREYSLNLMRFLGNSNFIGRLGGDNFIIYVKNDECEAFLKHIEMVPVTISANGAEMTLRITCRAGIYRAVEGDNHSVVIANAAVALEYTRRNHQDFIWYTKEMGERLMKEKQIIADFERAVLEDEFFIQYQPKISMKTKKVCGAEALVSWIKNGKKADTEEFISVLEKNHKVSELDFYMLRSALRDISEWMAKGITPVPVSINFSRVHLENPDFGKRIIAEFDCFRVPAEYLEIEITESASIEDPEVIEKFIKIMHQRGIKVAIDDFGKGYSSLALIDTMSFDIVKLDKSFIAGIDEKKHRNFVNQVIHMLKSLDYQVTCEGIESEEQETLLEIAGCDVGQGYLYGKNLSKPDFEALIIG